MPESGRILRPDAQGGCLDVAQVAAEPTLCRQPPLRGQQRGDRVVAALVVDLGHPLDVVPTDVILWYAIEQRVSLGGLSSTRRGIVRIERLLALERLLRMGK
jgi:hypothetical protein